MSKHTLNESQIRQIVAESLEQALLEEGLWNNLMAAFKGAKDGYSAQKSLDKDNSNLKHYHDYEDYKDHSNPYIGKMKNTAEEEAEELLSKAKEYKALSNRLLAKRNALIKQYGLVKNAEGKYVDPIKGEQAPVLDGSLRRTAHGLANKYGGLSPR